MTTRFHPGLTISDYQIDEDVVVDDRPVIAVVVALWSPELTQHEATTMHELTLVTVETIRELGARVMLIDSSAQDQQAQTTDWHRDVDGFIFLGGADVHPGFYQDVSLDEPRSGIDPAADAFCLESIRQAVTDDDPVLTICRGTQLLNVAMGGTLTQHLDGHRSELADGNTGFVDETLTLQPDTKIRDLLGRQSVVVRGSHHQSIDAMGRGLHVTAHAPDATIEGVEHTDRTWVVGVQWHPEEPDASADDRRRLFAALIAQARTRRDT